MQKDSIFPGHFSHFITVISRRGNNLSQSQIKWVCPCEYKNEMENTDMAEKRCYTVKELQEILGVSRPSAYELLKRQEFRWILVGGKYRISRKSFDEWLDNQEQ